MSNVRVRFALSPVGFINVGNARTALFNYIFAKKMGGELIIRIEETDTDRAKEESIAQILSDLRWLKLEWDEGPNLGGRFGPYRQSLRTRIYQDEMKKLIDSGSVYPCYCSAEDLQQRRDEALAKGIAPRYDNRCRSLSESDKLGLENKGVKPVWRFKVEPQDIVVNDLIRGDVTFDTKHMGDFVVLKSDETPTFQFAVTVDDALMEVTHVIRGEDHLPNTPSQVLLYRALGYELPKFAHLGLIKGDDNESIKRDLSDYHSVSGLRSKGYLSESIVNYLFNLGTASSEGKEILSRDDIIDQFDLRKVGTSSASFDIDKLNWFCGYYIRNADLERITELTIPYLKESNLVSGGLNEEEYRYLGCIVDVTRHNVSCLSEIVECASVFFVDKVEFSQEIYAFLNSSDSLTAINSLLGAMEQIESDLDKQGGEELLKGLLHKTDIKTASFYKAVRLVLTGKNDGPELNDVICLLGKDKIISRIKDFLKQDDQIVST